MPLHEVLTSSTCGPCLQGNANLQSIFDPDPHKQVYLRYQMNFPSIGDPYYTTEGGDRRLFYNRSGIPLLFVDGFYVGNPINYTAAMRDGFYAVSTNIKLLVDYEVRCKTVNIDVKVISTGTYPAGNKLRLAIFEETTRRNATSNQETHFYHVMKKFAPDENGINLGALSPGDTVSLSTSYTFQGDYRLPTAAGNEIDHSIEHSVEEFYDLGIAAFVQNDASGTVHQAAYGVDRILRDGAMIKMLEPFDDYINGAPYTVTTIFENWQESQINSADFHYSVDGGPTRTTSISGLNIGKGDRYTVYHSMTWTPPGPGTYTIRSWADNFSGGNDQVSCNDTLTQTITIEPFVVEPDADFTWTGSGTVAWFNNMSAEDPDFSSDYLWEFDDNGATSTQRDPVYAFTQMGSFDVCLYASNVVGSDSICKNLIVPITGLDQGIQSDLKVFPNPGSGIFMLENSDQMPLDLRVFDIEGLEIRSFAINQGISSIDLNGLEPGLYFFEFIGSKGKERTKVIIR